MIRRRGNTGSLFAAALLLSASSACQHSFLDEFRSINTSDSVKTAVHRPAFLRDEPLESDREINSLEEYTGINGPDAITEPEGGPPIHSVSEAVIHAAENEGAGCVPEDGCEVPLVRFRNGCFQGSQASFGWVGDNSDSGLTVRTFDTSATFAVPLKGMDDVVTFSPFFRADLLDGAAALDIPDALYETGVKSCWRHPVNERLTSIVVVTPSVRSDFETSDGALRLFGMGLLTWQCSPSKLALSGGGIWTGREDFPVLPAMGLLWTPTPQWRLDLQFPSPRISHRIGKDGADSETWLYLAGVFGGNTWAVVRAGGQEDFLTLQDLRLVTGIEHLLTSNYGAFAETGWVFNRSLEYTNVAFERDLDATYMLRAGISF